MSKIKAIRGMNDILPEAIPGWQYLEKTVANLLAQYGFQEIRFPVVESTELFKRSIGEVTDIVEKEMYTFDDRNGDSLTLRPEGTACCVRACIEHGLLHNQQQRLWYAGPMFRHERPQKGRYRQFHQMGVEAYGFEGPDMDAELIAITARLWQALGLADDVSLQLNTLGSNAARAEYRNALVAYLQQHEDSLDEDSKRRLGTNPLRILDSKNPETQAILAEAPSLQDHLDEESRMHFDRLCQLLDGLGIDYEINSRLVRGLDYYNRTVFEWVTTALGAQGTVCAGGRYDGLVEQLGGKPVPAVGFAMGMERLVLLLEQRGQLADKTFHADVYIVAGGDAAQLKAMQLAATLRDALPGKVIISHSGGGSLKSQFKKADKSGAALVVILGEEELQSGQAGVKFLREEKPQQQVPFEALTTMISQEI